MVLVEKCARCPADIDEATGKPRAHDDKYLRDMLFNFLIAGRDTTAVCLTWLFYEVAQHPAVEAKVAWARCPAEGCARVC